MKAQISEVGLLNHEGRDIADIRRQEAMAQSAKSEVSTRPLSLAECEKHGIEVVWFSPRQKVSRQEPMVHVNRSRLQINAPCRELLGKIPAKVDIARQAKAFLVLKFSDKGAVAVQDKKDKYNLRLITALVILSEVLAVSSSAIHSHQLRTSLNLRMQALEFAVEVQELQLSQLRLQVTSIRDATAADLEAIISELERWEIIELTATAYSPYENISGMCADDNPWSTATGTVPGPGTVAVNPSVIPYGTRMYIQDYGWGVAEDTDALIRERTDLIDLFMHTYAEAINRGRRTVKVLINTGRGS